MKPYKAVRCRPLCPIRLPTREHGRLGVVPRGCMSPSPVPTGPNGRASSATPATCCACSCRARPVEGSSSEWVAVRGLGDLGERRPPPPRNPGVVDASRAMNDQGEDGIREQWGLALRSTATSSRRVRISASFAASERASSASQPNTRTSVKYASRKATARDHAGPARDGDAECRPTEGAVQARQSSRHPRVS